MPCKVISLLFVVVFAIPAPAGEPKQLRIGIIGCDTSHAGVFTSTFNNPKLDPNTEPHLAGFKVVAAFPGGSPDLPVSANRVQKFTDDLRNKGVEIVDSIESLLAKVDVVLLLSVDGRVHLKQVEIVFKSGKRVFIDKPLTAGLADAIQIVELSKQTKTPFFSASSLRWNKKIDEVKADAKVGPILGCSVHYDAARAEHHPDLSFYGIHGLEAMYAIMGKGCQTVARTATQDYDIVTCVWADGRVATYRGIRAGKVAFGATIYGKGAIAQVTTTEGYTPMLREVGKFFRGGMPPVSNEEMLEVIAVIDAADISKAHGGVPVALADVFKGARAKISERR
jgi:predicted dehydrogenase